MWCFLFVLFCFVRDRNSISSVAPEVMVVLMKQSAVQPTFYCIFSFSCGQLTNSYTKVGHIEKKLAQDVERGE